MSPNRLIDEKSPNLRQHAGNPVDWHPWGSEWLEKARALAAAVAGTVTQQPTAFTHFLTGLDAPPLPTGKSSSADSLP